MVFKVVTMYTNKLRILRGFYENVLEFPITETGKDFFKMTIGDSVLIFAETEEDTLYHYAINIPGNQFVLAKYWAKNKVTLNREAGVEDIYYSRFDADAFYFEDPAGNVIEFIARRHVDKWSDFSVDSFINISEVSITTPLVQEVGEKLQEIGIPISGNYQIEPDSLNFLGRNASYIILVPPQRRWYFSKQMSKTSKVDIELESGQHISISKEGYINLDNKTGDVL